MNMNIFIRQNFGRGAVFKNFYILNVWKPIALQINRDVGEQWKCLRIAFYWMGRDLFQCCKPLKLILLKTLGFVSKFSPREEHKAIWFHHSVNGQIL